MPFEVWKYPGRFAIPFARMRDGGVSIVQSAFAFGWKYSLVLCQRELEYFMLQAQLSRLHIGVIIVHYPDDFMAVGGHKERVRQVTAHGMHALTKMGFTARPKLKLRRDTQLKSLGKDLRFGVGVLEGEDRPRACIGNTERAGIIGYREMVCVGYVGYPEEAPVGFRTIGPALSAP